MGSHKLCLKQQLPLAYNQLVYTSYAEKKHLGLADNFHLVVDPQQTGTAYLHNHGMFLSDLPLFSLQRFGAGSLYTHYAYTVMVQHHVAKDNNVLSN